MNKNKKNYYQLEDDIIAIFAFVVAVIITIAEYV